MKVGIMTMHRIVNYGSFLQAFGLMKIIESLGHQASFVDYSIDKPIFKSKTDKVVYVKKSFLKRILKLATVVPFFSYIMPPVYEYSVVSNRIYALESKKHLMVSNKKIYSPCVDVLVIGSDEVFNCTQTNPDVGYSLELFGKNANANKVCTYAASFGNTDRKSVV